MRTARKKRKCEHATIAQMAEYIGLAVVAAGKK